MAFRQYKNHLNITLDKMINIKIIKNYFVTIIALLQKLLLKEV